MTIISSDKKSVSELRGGDLEKQLRVTLAELYELWRGTGGSIESWLSACRRELNYAPGQKKLKRSKQRENALQLLSWAEGELKTRQRGAKTA